jgi:hypothetical protein
MSFLRTANGLEHRLESETLTITQRIDQKSVSFPVADFAEVIPRKDDHGKTFLQVNFHSGKRILVTDALIGFKPHETVGLDMAKLPKVVTTPDILSVFEAIEETLGIGDSEEYNVETLKKVYLSVILGGELVGFDLQRERAWLERLLVTQTAASA